MKVKILKCSDSRLWYNSCINKTYEVRRIEGNLFWVRPEIDAYSGWNWLYAEDCEEIKE